MVVPAAMRLVWAEELEKWLPALRPSRIHVIESKADRLRARALHPSSGMVTGVEVSERSPQ